MAHETQQAAQIALTRRLKSLLPDDIVDRFVGGTHTQRFADNLLPGLSAEQVRRIRDQLGQGAGGELRPTATGKRRAHAPYSSAALAANAFGGWLGNETTLRVAGLGGFASPISLEHKLKIAHGGGEANLDCVLTQDQALIGIESKLTETLAPHDSVLWRAPYHDPRMKTLLNRGWKDAFEASLTGSWKPSHLGLEQLIKHALALSSHAQERATHLVYVYWEPADGDDITEVVAHRDEVARLRELVADSEPRLHTLTYDQLIAEWSAAASAEDNLLAHIEQLRARYSEVAVLSRSS